MPRCGDCYFWDGPQGDDDCGDCHRFPPVLIPGGVGRDDDFRHPETHEEDWCGEWKERKIKGTRAWLVEGEEEYDEEW